MAESEGSSWKELCNAALQERDPTKLMKIVQQLNNVLQVEENIQRDLRNARKHGRPSEDVEC